ncbi:multicopper oxidase domain-containing protein [Sorangium sp. So ce233]|uniref:multicopper oxidase domain-containing protein n=1 Tax=Sorangium sp. So ce233 TaxID=3133290 RepID=UPI003F5EEC35
MSNLNRLLGAMGWAAVMLGLAGCADQGAPPTDEDVEETSAGMGESGAPASGRTVYADVVALDQVYVYNRFGSFNPAGMIYALKRDVVPIRPHEPLGPGNARLRDGKRPRPLVLRVNVGDTLRIKFTNLLRPADRRPDDSPKTRSASVHVTGLQIKNIESLGGRVGRSPDSLADPGETRVYELFADREGPFLMHSAGAMAGGQGAGGQIVQGLFGAVHVEPPGAVAYRSQVTAEELEAASLPRRNPDGTPRIDYEARDEHGEPILRMINDRDEIVHGDLDAIIADYEQSQLEGRPPLATGRFREITVLFHDEINAVQAFRELEVDEAFQGVRDGFAINYGASGFGAILLANRARIGPSKECVECKFEEFFLSSWTGGDPAMIVERDRRGKAVRALFPGDPSNVQHAYLGDPVWFRNLHAGPRETHVFHLHAHQWLLAPNNDNAFTRDSQSIGPGGAFTYNIGRAGSRALTAGDAIFHCHLYPHFAQGMWGLLRNHDVFEAGTRDRRLPDGEIEGGTPTPAIVPIPELAMPPMPTYEPTLVELPGGRKEVRKAMPGYPFYIAAREGHRAPQPPLDLAVDGGLPRHIVTSVPPGGARFGERGRFDVELLAANLKLLPQEGTPTEQAAQDFHAGRFPGARSVMTHGFPTRVYPAFTPEGEPSEFAVNGQEPKPGAYYTNPCPAGARERKYRSAFVQIDAVVNRRGWHDPQLRLMVLEDDIKPTLLGDKPPEPLFIRANSGECVISETTNLMPDALERDDFQIFTPTDSVGQHIHLVKFDLTSADGGANGFNYEDGTFAAADVVQRIEAANALGGALAADGTVRERGARVELEEQPHPRIGRDALGSEVVGLQTTVQRWWADPVLNQENQDLTLNTVLGHDHLAASSHQQHGLYMALIIEPRGSVWRDSGSGVVFGSRKDGGPTSFRADILPPSGSVHPPFREFGLALSDFALLYDECERPVNPPTAQEAPLPLAVDHPRRSAPEVVSSRDPGSQIMNYRQEPIPLRIAERDCRSRRVTQKPGEKGEMHNVFSSRVHGDPFTPVLLANEGDHIRVRLVQGSHEEQHVFSINGQRWFNEIDDPDSGYSNGQPLGVSEHFEFELAPRVAALGEVGVGDYMYQSAPTDDLWDGVWGLLRIRPRNATGLLPLPPSPGWIPHEERGFHTCPASAPVTRYTVHAITAKGNLPGDRLTYNREFDLYDPDAILFVRAEDLSDLRAGRLAPEPLMLRAAAGDCIQVTLVNDLPRELPRTPHWNYNPPIIDGFNTNQVRSSNHVSLHPQLVAYDVRTDDGANVGLNEPQTVPPGASREYTWYAGEFSQKDGRWGPVEPRAVEYGAINLRDMADVVNHGMHGAIGALIIEPKGATWRTDPGTRAQAEVTFTDVYGYTRSFREFVVVYQDEVALHSRKPRFQCLDRDLNCGTALRNQDGEDDAEETGHEAFNYRTEPFWARLGIPPELASDVLNERDLSDIFSSHVHGDPATPIFTAGAHQKVRVRLLQPSGHHRQHAFGIWNTEWPHNPFAEGERSRRIGENREVLNIAVENPFGPMVHRNIVPFFPAGGKFAVPGDRLYLEQMTYMLSNGQWGLFRVVPR